MQKILFTGGGSAGHVIPNLALIEELLSQGKTDVCYMGTSGIEKRLITAQKIPYYTVECPKLIRGNGFAGLKNNLRIPFALHKAVKEAEKGLKIFQPDLVFSKGGFVSLPAVLAASKLNIPCIAHESDFSIGLANRLSAKKCKLLLTAFPETAQTLKNGKYGGAPIRRAILSADRAKARASLSISDKEKVLLVFGGGSGSKAINDALRARLHSLTQKYTVLHICGRGNEAENNFKKYRQFPFVLDMGSMYACADLVIARAGAGTVFELLALKKPAILIPLEGASRGDQKENAEYFRKRGLCRVLPQERLKDLEKEIDEAFADTDLKKRLLENRFSQGNARILQEINALLHA
jgi:UDP-N-acetylglucosamine--N-acetylmuramyl-(pentapeptide) pyrophosphoryl-undecaprenol N-acetylglucosamine transferase